MIVYSMRAIAACEQVVGNGLTSLFGQNGLVRVLRRSEILDPHSGKHFKLGIDRAGTNDRHFKLTGRIHRRQPLQIRQRLFRICNTCQCIHVKEGFQLHENDIGLCVPCCAAVGSGGDRIQNILHRFPAVIVRLVHPPIHDAQKKTIAEPIVVIRIGKVREIGGYPTAGEAADQQEHQHQRRSANGHQRTSPVNAAPTRANKQENKTADAKRETCHDQNDLRDCEVVVHDGNHAEKDRKVYCSQWRDAGG